MSDQEKITDETVIESTWQYNDSHEIRVGDLDEPFDKQLLNAQENEVKARAWDEFYRNCAGFVQERMDEVLKGISNGK